MNFSGSYFLENTKEKVWELINNPKVLMNCIDGCKEFTEIEKNKFFLKVLVKIGPINANFSGTLLIKDINEPQSYIIEASGSAGQLGGASGNVFIKLSSKESQTCLYYDASTKINGKIAQLGSRLIEGAVKKNTTSFFKNFESYSKNKTTNNTVSVSKRNIIASNYNPNKLLDKKYIYSISIVFLIVFIIIIISNE